MDGLTFETHVGPQYEYHGKLYICTVESTWYVEPDKHDGSYCVGPACSVIQWVPKEA